MAHIVSVKQLCSINNGRAFLNVDEGYGHISVWTSTYKTLTFLLRNSKNTIVRLIQFDDPDWAYEWLIANNRYFDEIEVL
jgi:hypothetical protein